MKCHYEVLDISREADDNEIKTAYRKLALKWHPDKNLENTEYAKEQFQLVQQAYEVLSDRQERAWYDKHREQILRGSDSEYKDNNLDVFQYFTTTCFKGYGDDEKGFYHIYSKVFEQLAKEDSDYVDASSIPIFGNSKSDYEDVAQFYDYWMSYSTKKSYVWLDPHNIKDAPNRKIFKLIEKENDKIRQKAKRERNEEVRNLVAFVRKRDKRVQAHIKELEEKKSLTEKSRRKSQIRKG
ncbi:dnaj subfamily c member 21 [Holotrichia oblita]|uniref:Dnaj subfamily c member 21 n=1 Tax=Holotrichia oblita TaxID=644536 RepID=A0ACB9TL89_HOLOL|nr:dnaj subfamily c member 21 [Holotrichia oblita]